MTYTASSRRQEEQSPWEVKHRRKYHNTVGEEESGKSGTGHSGSFGSAADTGISRPSVEDDYASAIGDNRAFLGEMPQYSSPYEGQIDSLYADISGRGPFRYSAEADPLYRQYRQQYSLGGLMAMHSSMGQAASLTGGYGSSYSQAVGQQQYGEHMRQLADVLPRLYSQAYGIYKDEGDELYRRMDMLNTLDSTEYDRYRDRVSDWKYRQDTELELQEQAYDRMLYMMQMGNYMPGEQELKNAGVSRKQALSLYAALHPQSAYSVL